MKLKRRQNRIYKKYEIYFKNYESEHSRALGKNHEKSGCVSGSGLGLQAISRTLFPNQTFPKVLKNVDSCAPCQDNRIRTSGGGGGLFESELSTASHQEDFYVPFSEITTQEV